MNHKDQDMEFPFEEMSGLKSNKTVRNTND